MKWIQFFAFFLPVIVIACTLPEPGKQFRKTAADTAASVTPTTYPILFCTTVRGNSNIITGLIHDTINQNCDLRQNYTMNYLESAVMAIICCNQK